MIGNEMLHYIISYIHIAYIFVVCKHCTATKNFIKE